MTAAEAPRKAITFEILLNGWAAEKQPTEKTLYNWKRVLEQLGAFVGHGDAARLTPDDLLRWKASLLEAGLRTKTIRDSKIAPLRAILQWGVDNRKLPVNSAARIVIDVRSKMTERIRGFTDEEAALILRTAATEQDPVRRWVPLLCAYSGARPSEVCQLRVLDVLQRGEIWCIKFDPEAERSKTRTRKGRCRCTRQSSKAGSFDSCNPPGPVLYSRGSQRIASGTEAATARRSSADGSAASA